MRVVLQIVEEREVRAVAQTLLEPYLVEPHQGQTPTQVVLVQLMLLHTEGVGVEGLQQLEPQEVVLKEAMAVRENKYQQLTLT